MRSTQEVNKLLQLINGISGELSFDPNVPTDVRGNELLDIVRAAAPLLLIVFGTPEAAAEGLRETFDQLFARLDCVVGSLDRIEESVMRLEQKHDAATLAKFRAAFRELRDGTRAQRQSYRQQLLFSARNKLTELAELPPGLDYSALPSHTIAAASCSMIATIDTWSGEIGSAQRYNLRAIVAHPLWSEEFLPKCLIHSVAGALLDKPKQDTILKLNVEATRNHNFFWHKVAVGGVGVLSTAVVGVVWRKPHAGTQIGLRTIEEIRKLGTPEAQQEARDKAMQAVRENAMQQRENILRVKANERLKELGD